MHAVETVRASPFASSLLFDYVATYMYEGDAPLAERRAQALTLDRDLLRELLGQEELRELLDPAALVDLELALQCLTEDRRASTLDQVHDLLRRLGDLTDDEVSARVDGTPEVSRAWLGELESARRAVRVGIAGQVRWIAIEDAGRYRDAVGTQPPSGVPDAFLGPVPSALESLLARWARTHGPFLTPEPVARWALPMGVVGDALDRLMASGALVRGEFRPGGAEREWCDPDVLRQLRRRSLARLRHEVEPVGPAALARFLPTWQGVAPSGARLPPLRGGAALERLAEVVDQLAGVPIPASVLERDVLPARVPGYQPRLLDQLGALGEVPWEGRGALGRDDGRVVLFRPHRDMLRDLAGTNREADPPDGLRHQAIRELLATRGASFYREIYTAVGGGTDRDVLDAVWDLVWAGEVTNDTFTPLRALRWRRPSNDPRRRPSRLTSLGPPEAAGRWSLSRDDGRAAATAPSVTERLHAWSLALLERHGVLTREAVVAEGIVGGFTAVYPVLRAMEEAGRIRRGYFVEGLGAAQFALPGAVERLRSHREPEAVPLVHLLAATDPANPFGAGLPWPRRPDGDKRPPSRTAGAYVAIVGGEAVLYVERGGTACQALPAAGDPSVAALAVRSLAELAADGRVREVVVTRVDGRPVADSPMREAFVAVGFTPGYRGLTLRGAGREMPPVGFGSDGPGPASGLDHEGPRAARARTGGSTMAPHAVCPRVSLGEPRSGGRRDGRGGPGGRRGRAAA